MFLRDVDDWPFPNLPSPGDAVFLDVPSSGGLKVERIGDLTEITPRLAFNIGAREVKRVLYFPQDGQAVIEMHSQGSQNWTVGVDDQVNALLGAGFREVTRPDGT
jgi:hypothetical protein